VFSDLLPSLTKANFSAASMKTAAGWTSLMQIRLIMEIELAFELKIPAKEIAKLTAVKAIQEYLLDLQ
jgi:acyl carrier protein